MNVKGKMMSRGQFAATVVVISMLLCACIPAVTAWNQEYEAASNCDEYIGMDDGVFTYVSLGDSMVNGFGTNEYYPANCDNVHGLLNPVTDTYPDRINTYLEGIYDKVDWVQLGISATRSAELRYLIDPDFSGDARTPSFIKDSKVQSIGSLMPEGYDKTVNGLRQLYIDNLTKADLITYQFHYDFGYTLTDCILTSVKGGSLNEMDFDIYLDEEFLQMFGETYSQVKEYLLQMLVEQGIVLDSSILAFAENIAKGMAYTVVSYCANFDGNMAAIFSLNPDVRIIVLDSYNTLGDLNMVYDGITIPLGEIYQVLLDAVNLYTKWLSPYAFATYHVDIDGVQGLLADEFKNADVESPDIDADAKNAFISIYAKHMKWDMENGKDVCDKIIINEQTIVCADFYDSIDGKNHNLTKLLNAVFSTTDMDWKAFMDGNLNDNVTAAVTDLITAVEYIRGGGTNADVQFVDGTCTVSVPGRESIVLDQYELAFAWMQLYLNEISSAMSHPTPGKGHAVIFGEVLEVIEGRNVLIEDRCCIIEEIKEIVNAVEGVLSGPYNPDYQEPVLKPSTGVPSEHTVVSLCDQSAYMGDNCYPALLAEMLGLDYDYVELPSGCINGINLGPRIDDINYILGGTDVIDGYGGFFNIEFYQDDVQESVAKADVVILQAGLYNALFPVMETYLQSEYGGNMPFDISSLDILDPEFYEDLMSLVNKIECIAVGIFGEDIAPTIKIVNMAIESSIYSLAGFIENYPEAVAAIYNLNSDADIVILGINNFLDGFYVPIGDDGTEIDLGFFGQFIAGAMNYALESMIPEAENIHFVDITDVETKASAIGEVDIKAAIETMESHMQIFGILNLCAPSDNGQLQIAEAIEEIFTEKEYTVSFNVEFQGEVSSCEYLLGYGEEIPECSINVPSGYSFTGWDGVVPDTMPARDLVFNAKFVPTDMKMAVEFDEDGNLVTTIIGLDGSYAEGALYVNIVYGSVDDAGVFDTGTVTLDGVDIDNKNGGTFIEVTTYISEETKTIQSVWVEFQSDLGTTLTSPHILYQYTEVSA